MTGNRPSKNSPSPPRHKRLWRRLVATIVALIAMALVVGGALWVHRVMENFSRPECQYYLQQLGLLCKMWEGEHDGEWPKLSDTPGEFMVDPEVVSGEPIRGYGPPASILTCPRSTNYPPAPGYPGDTSYIYLGPGLETEEKALAFLDAYLEAALANHPLPTPDYNQNARQSADPVEEAKRQSATPVAFDRPQNHDYKGINVLFADGHVEWHTMATRYPATKSLWDKLEHVESEILRAHPQP